MSDPTATFGSPGRLYRGARLSLACAPVTVGPGKGSHASTPDTATFGDAVLIPPGRIARSVNIGQRDLAMAFSLSVTGLDVTASPDPSVAPPGYTLLRLLNLDGPVRLAVHPAPGIETPAPSSGAGVRYTARRLLPREGAPHRAPATQQRRVRIMTSRTEPSAAASTSERRPLPAATIAGLAALPAAALAGAWLRLGLPRPHCVWRSWTGVPCPTCGTTRMLDALASGDVLAAAGWNPLMFAVLVAGTIWTAASASRWALGLPARERRSSPRLRRVLVALGAALVAANWIYLVWRGV